jgi:ribosome-associated toxin RatA of RatAB toxin-antitoxin module
MEAGREKNMIKSVINIQASREEVYSVLVDYNDWRSWVPGCQTCTITSSDGNRTEADLVLSGMKTISLSMRFEAQENQSLRFELTKSKDLKSYAGIYRLMDAASGGGAVVIAELEMDAGAMVPKFMLDKMVRKSLEDMGKALQGRVKAKAAAAPVAAGAARARAGAPAAQKKRARRILQISRTGAGYRVWYMGKIYRSDG